MYEVDFLPVESPGQSSSKCGDAVAINFTYATEKRQAVIVIDGGYTDTGSDLAEHIRCYYDTNVVDLVVSTHPDADHINGLRTLLGDMEVRQLMIHQPVRAENSIRAGQAAARYSWMTPPRRSCRPTVRRSIRSASRASGRACNGAAAASDRWVRCRL